MPATDLSRIQIRDPYVLTVPEEGAYYLFGSTDADIWDGPGTGFDCYRSTDLEAWEGPYEAFRPGGGFWAEKNFWAPEVHRYQGRYYMLATFKAEDVCRGTQILVSDRPEGPYAPWSDGPVTPADWECLDGTLHVDESGTPWIVYCHEWLQVRDGEMVAQRLTSDLRAAVGEPRLLFRATDAAWVRPVDHPLAPVDADAFVTDGPFLHRTEEGALLMLWSSHGDRGYAMGIARSESGTVLGPWVQQAEPLWGADGGHGMIATTLDGRLLLTLHSPNTSPDERAHFHPLIETAEGVALRR